MHPVNFRRIVILGAALFIGGCSERHQSSTSTDNSQTAMNLVETDEDLTSTLGEMVAVAQLDQDGYVIFSRPLEDRRYLDPNSGHYWQISGEGQVELPSRSLWDRTLKVDGRRALQDPFFYDSDQLSGEPLRIAERTVRLPGSEVEWQFMVAIPRIERSE